MNLRTIAIVLLSVFCGSSWSFAETIGIRFVVNNDLGVSEADRKTTLNKLKSYIDTLNAYYRNSEVIIKAEIVQIEFARIEAVDDIP